MLLALSWGVLDSIVIESSSQLRKCLLPRRTQTLLMVEIHHNSGDEYNFSNRLQYEELEGRRLQGRHSGLAVAMMSQEVGSVPSKGFSKTRNVSLLGDQIPVKGGFNLLLHG